MTSRSPLIAPIQGPLARGTRPGMVLGILTGLNALNYLDRYVLAGVLPLMIAELRIGDAQAGSLQTAFILVYALVSPLPGWLGDRFRRLRIAAAGVCLWSAATVATGLAPTFAWLLLARAFVGFGEVSYSVVAPSLLADLYPADRRARALGVFYAAISVGAALGYIVGGALGDRFGWRIAFFIAGGPGVLLALVLMFIPEPPRGRYDPPPLRPSSPRSPGGTARALWARRSYLVNTAAQTIYTFSMGGLAVWMPTYFVRERGIPLAHASLVFGGILAVAGLAGTLLGGVIGDRLARRSSSAHFSFSGWALVASAPFTLLAILSPRPAIFWPSMFATLLLLFLNTGPLNAAMTNVLPADLRARGFAAYTTAIHVFGDGPSPALIGVASDRVGLKLPVLATGLLLVVAGVVLLAGRRTLTRDLEAASA